MNNNDFCAEIDQNNVNKQICEKLFAVCDAIKETHLPSKAREKLKDFLKDQLSKNTHSNLADPELFLKNINNFLEFAYSSFAQYNIENTSILENTFIKSILSESFLVFQQSTTKVYKKLNEIASILDKLYDGVLFIEISNRKITFANKVIRDILQVGSLIGKDVLNFVEDNKKEYYQALFLKFTKQKKGITELLEFKSADAIVQLEASVNMLNEEMMVVVLRDVTQRLVNEALLVRINKLYEVLSRINNLIVRIQDTDKLYEQVCNILVKFGNFKLAWFGCVDPNTKIIKPKAYAGEEKYLKNIAISVKEDTPYGQGPSGVAIRESKVVVCNNILESTLMSLWREQAKRSGFKSSITIPITIGETEYASFVLKVYSSEINYFDKREVRLFEEIASDVDYAIDFIEKKRKIAFLSSFDPLTNLPNRTMFGYTIENLIKSKKSFSIIICDINNFTAINNRFGYIKGDAILKTVTNSMLNINVYYASRTGSDEFGFLLTTNDKLEILKIVREIEFKTRSLNFGIDLNLDFSIGISIYPTDGESGEKIIANAEIACLNSKKRGLLVSFYSKQENEEIQKQLDIQSKLRNAVENDEFVLFYQPILKLSDYSIKSVEALLRWNSKDGIILPSRFITGLEETKLIINLGYQIFEKALRQIKNWQKNGLNIRVAVNVSPIQLSDEQFIDKVLKLIEDYNAPKELIEIEITESTLVQEMETLTILNKEGINIVIDDFGTGYSSLSYLKEAPICGIKIDIAFVREMFNEKNLKILKIILDLSKALNLKTIAEGVETKKQLAVLKSFGCDFVQGFLIEKPSEAENIEKFFNNPFIIK